MHRQAWGGIGIVQRNQRAEEGVGGQSGPEPEACSEEVEIGPHNGQRCRVGFRGPRPEAAQGRGSSISGNQGSQLGSALGWPQSQ